MNGQWIGNYTGSSHGMIIVNIDERSTHYQGVVYLLESNTALPSVAASFNTPDKSRDLHFRTVGIAPVNPLTGLFDVWDNVKTHYPDVNLSKYADVEGSWDEALLKLRWNTDIGVAGSCELPRSNANRPSELRVLGTQWEEYKAYVATLEGRRYLFRGQNDPRRLRTSFHRTGRADLVRFLAEDIQVLHKQLSAQIKHVFNLKDPDENGAFFSLVQHHGYPTPLLDWTYSPYVAAFFAYRGISNEKAAKAGTNDKVRILVFDQAQWKADLPQPLQLVSAWLYVSIAEFIAIENERMIPQQAASTVTNVDDIETYIRTKEAEGKNYLWAFDLPVRGRKQITRELGYMGITAGSLFPGLDGACEALPERNFDV